MEVPTVDVVAAKAGEGVKAASEARPERQKRGTA